MYTDFLIVEKTRKKSKKFEKNQTIWKKNKKKGKNMWKICEKQSEKTNDNFKIKNKTSSSSFFSLCFYQEKYPI